MVNWRAAVQIRANSAARNETYLKKGISAGLYEFRQAKIGVDVTRKMRVHVHSALQHHEI